MDSSPSLFASLEPPRALATPQDESWVSSGRLCSLSEGRREGWKGGGGGGEGEEEGD